jgi:hypothetical protein
MISLRESSCLLKGAIIGTDIFNPPASVVVFRYNQDTLPRTLQVRGVGAEGGDRSEALRLKGPPEDTNSLGSETGVGNHIMRGETRWTAMTSFLGSCSLDTCRF